MAGSVSINQAHETVSAGAAALSGSVAGAITLRATNDATIQSVAGSLALSGRVGLGTAVAFNDLDNTVRATLVDTRALARGADLSLQATDAGRIATASGSAGIGRTFGVAGTVSVNQIQGTVEAAVRDSNDTPASGGSVSIGATEGATILSLAGAFGLGGTVGFGAALGWNDIGTTVRTAVEGSTLHSAGAMSFSASNKPGIESLSVGVAGSRNTALAGSVSYNLIQGETDAHVNGNSSLTAGGALSVTATENSSTVANAGGAAVGGQLAIGAAVGISEFKDSVQAEVQGSTVTAGGAVLIDAEFAGDVQGSASGAAGAGSVAIAGSAAVGTFKAATTADVLASTVTTTNTLDVTALDTTKLRLYGGSGAGGLSAVGVGGAVAVAEVGNATVAKVQNSTTSSDKKTSIKATSNSDVGTQAASLAGSGMAGVSGSVAVVQVDNSTLAELSGGKDRSSSASSLEVKADQTATAKDLVGGVGLGGKLGIGAAIDVIEINGRVDAAIDGGAAVTTTGNVDVLAVGKKTVESKSVATGAGILGVGIAGSFSLIGVGSPLSGQGASQASTATSVSNNSLQGSGVSTQLSNASTPHVVASVDSGAHINSGAAINVKATDMVDVTVYVGQLAAGLVGVGGSVGLVDLGGGTEAFVGGGASLSAAGAIGIEGYAKNDVGDFVYAGTAGPIAAIGAKVSIVNDNSNQRAAIDSGASITRSTTVSVWAHADRNLFADGVTVQEAGGLAAGVAIGQVKLGGGIAATVDRAFIGQQGDVGNLSVKAEGSLGANGHEKAI